MRINIIYIYSYMHTYMHIYIHIRHAQSMSTTIYHTPPRRVLIDLHLILHVLHSNNINSNITQLLIIKSISHDEIITKNKQKSLPYLDVQDSYSNSYKLGLSIRSLLLSWYPYNFSLIVVYSLPN